MQANEGNGGLQCEALVVRYGQLTAVDRVSFEAGRGEIVGLLGPNGAGKTSVIRALTTVITPVAGSATVAGAAITDALAVRHRIGVLPESSGYPGNRSAVEYLRFHGRLFVLDRTQANRRAVRLLGELGLGERKHSRIATFSRGMRQRLGIARSLINDPAVLFLDEPTLGLDPAGKEDILARVREVARERGATVLISSHLLDEVERVCDHVVIMHRGKVAAAGAVADVVAQAGVVGEVRIRVADAALPGAAAVLEALPEVRSVDNAGRGELLIDLSSPLANDNALLSALIAAGIAIEGFGVAGGRLGDAFFALTDSDRPAVEAEDAA